MHGSYPRRFPVIRTSAVIMVGLDLAGERACIADPLKRQLAGRIIRSQP